MVCVLWGIGQCNMGLFGPRVFPSLGDPSGLACQEDGYDAATWDGGCGCRSPVLVEGLRQRCCGRQIFLCDVCHMAPFSAHV